MSIAWSNEYPQVATTSTDKAPLRRAHCRLGRAPVIPFLTVHGSASSAGRSHAAALSAAQGAKELAYRTNPTLAAAIGRQAAVEEANRHAANVIPVIAATGRSGVSTFAGIADALNARGVWPARRQVPCLPRDEPAGTVKSLLAIDACLFRRDFRGRGGFGQSQKARHECGERRRSDRRGEPQAGASDAIGGPSRSKCSLVGRARQFAHRSAQCL